MARFRAPSVPLGGADVQFKLDIVDNDGQAASAATAVHVWNRRDPRTFLRMKGQPGDPIVGDQLVFVTDDLTPFFGYQPYGAWFNFGPPVGGDIAFEGWPAVLPPIGSYSNAIRMPVYMGGLGLDCHSSATAAKVLDCLPPMVALLTRCSATGSLP